MKTIHHVYILECENNRLYTGYATDPFKRYQQHVDKTAKCKFTRSFRPKKLLAIWSFGVDKSNALSAEKFIKSLSKKEKLQLIKNPQMLQSLYEDASVLTHCQKQTS